MSLGTDFLTAFLKAYDAMRAGFDAAAWKRQWTDTKQWSQLMIYDRAANTSKVDAATSETDAVRACVIRAVSDSLPRLRCWEGRPYEPLHLDAVFSARELNSWFPIHIAVEHENKPHLFLEEVQKLCALSCPCKVGITYALTSDGPVKDVRARVEGHIRRGFSAANTLLRENEATEYLFLLGCEVGAVGEIPEIQWQHMIFTASSGPEKSSFQ